MRNPDRNQATAILHRLAAGDATAAADLMPLVYEELRRLAAGYFRGQRPGGTLQPTALVHEAFLRLAGQTGAEWNDRAHFFRVAAMAMRQILVDHARRRGAGKRAGDRERVTIEEPASTTAPSHGQVVDLIALDAVLRRLESLDARQCRIVELRYFAGMTIEETARALGVHTSTVEDGWATARAWLARELSA